MNVEAELKCNGLDCIEAILDFGGLIRDFTVEEAAEIAEDLPSTWRLEIDTIKIVCDGLTCVTVKTTYPPTFRQFCTAEISEAVVIIGPIR